MTRTSGSSIRRRSAAVRRGPGPRRWPPAHRGPRRAPGREAALDAAVLEDLVTRYRELAAAGLAASNYRCTATAGDGRRIARRFLHFEEMILRFATRPNLDILPMRSSGGCWRTIEGLADFAVVQSYLSTAVKWELGKLDALRDLFNGRA